MNGRVEAWKGALEAKGWRENVKNKKVMNSKENAGKIAVEGKFPCPVNFKGVGINFSRH